MGDQWAARAGGLITPSSAGGLLVRSPQAGGPAWTPASLPDPICGWDFPDTASITSSSNLVSSVAGAWGTSVALTQSTGANKPLTNTDTINGLNVLTFDGTSSWMDAAIASVSQPVTILAVFKNAATDGSQRTVGYFSGASDGRMFRQGSDKLGMFAGSSVVDSGVTLGTSAAHQAVVVLNGASSAIYVDGGSATTGNPGTGPSAISTFRVGNTFAEYWKGTIAVVFVMGSAITSGDRTSWNTYCARFGL